MTFNEEIIDLIPQEKQWLARFVLVSCTNGGNLYDFITEPKHGFQFKESLHDAINDIVLALLQNEVADLYSGEHTRISILKPIIQTYKGKMQDIVDQARVFFKKPYSGYNGYHSDNKVIEALLNKWRIQYPELDVKQIPKACKLYIDDCKIKDRPLKKMVNFILEEKHGILCSDLATWIDQPDTKSSPAKKHRLM